MSITLASPARAEVRGAAAALAGARVAVLTGAGISTDSGIPDYRSPDAPARHPLSAAELFARPTERARFWVASEWGWQQLRDVRPNAGHLALAAMEAAGCVRGVLTQNVDGLHQRAGSRRVIELHGSASWVRCLGCDRRFPREAVSAQFRARNPHLSFLAEAPGASAGREWGMAPSAAGTSDNTVAVPTCPACEADLRPDVVLFGEAVPARRYDLAAALVRDADALLVAGSSLLVNTGASLVRQARRARLPIVFINKARTPLDRLASIRIQAGATETLTGLAALLDAAPVPASR